MSAANDACLNDFRIDKFQVAGNIVDVGVDFPTLL